MEPGSLPSNVIAAGAVSNVPSVLFQLGCTIVRSGAGVWAVTIVNGQGCSQSQYVCMATLSSGPIPTASGPMLTDGDATHKFFNTYVGGVATDLFFSFMFLRILPN